MPRLTSPWDILFDRRLVRGPLPWVAAAFLAANLTVARQKADLDAQRAANLLTTASAGELPVGPPPRYDLSVGESLERFWPAIPDATKEPLVVLSGMSQMYAINDPQPGDEIIVEHLDDKLRGTGVRAFGLAAPNMDNEEALLYLAALLAQPKTSPSVLVYGVCFDKFRNVDLRPRLLDFRRARRDAQDQLRAICATRSATFPRACEKVAGTLASLDKGAEAAQTDDSFEGEVRAAAGRVLPVVAERATLNAALQMQAFLLRNEMLGIKSTTKRPIIQSRHGHRTQEGRHHSRG